MDRFPSAAADEPEFDRLLELEPAARERRCQIRFAIATAIATTNAAKA